MKKNSVYAVIMAGGGGTRFWPWSREKRPKQILPILSDRSMIWETVERIRPLSPGKKFTSSPPAPRLPNCAGKSRRSRKKTFWPNRWGGIPLPAFVWRPSIFIGKTPEASWSSSLPIISSAITGAFYNRFAPPLTLPGNKTIWLRWGSLPPGPKRDTDISKKEDSSPKPAGYRFCRRNPSARNRPSPKPRLISEPANISGTAACSSGERMFSWEAVRTSSSRALRGNARSGENPGHPAREKGFGNDLCLLPRHFRGLRHPGESRRMWL